MNGFAKKYLWIVLLLMPLLGLAQDEQIEELRNEMQQLEKEIEFTKKKISEVKNKKESSLHSLVTLKKQIASRQKLVNNIEQQIDAINREINRKRVIIQALNEDLKRLKDEYAEMIYHTYVNNNDYSNLLFVFGAATFNDAYNRLRYLKTYAEYREKQAELIRKTRQNIEEEIARQESLREEKRTLLEKEKRQQEALANERKEVNNEVETFDEREEYYRQQIAKKEAAIEELSNKIEKLIAEAMKKKETKNPSEASGYELTPEAKALGEDFAANKGKLPWPVEHGTIIREFGNRPHPVLKNVTESSLGIGISTNKEEKVRAVFEGTVVEILYTPSSHRVVLVDHGTYFTVYANLKTVEVDKNQSISTKQELGTVYTDPDSGASELDFQLWKSSSGGEAMKLNPALWLYR